MARGRRQQDCFHCIGCIKNWCIIIHDSVIHLRKAFTSLDPQKSFDSSMDLIFRYTVYVTPLEEHMALCEALF